MEKKSETKPVKMPADAATPAQPERVVFLDAGFAGNDQLKANAVQSFKTAGIISLKTAGITSFKTV